MFVYLIWVKILQKVDFGEIKCGRISDSIMNSEMMSEISVRYFIYKKSSQVQKNKCNKPRNRGR